MKHAFLDEHSHIESLIHHLDPRIKIISFGVFVILIVMTGPASWLVFALYGALLSGLVLLSKVPVGYIFRRSLVVIPFVIMITLFIPFMKPGTTAGAYSLGPLSLSVTYEGLLIFWTVLIKAWFSLLCMILLTSTTSFPDLLKSLEKLKFPALMTMILSFMYRYAFVMEDEFMQMRQAKESRSVNREGWLNFRATANMIGVLFIRAYERAETVYLAMCSRGFNGHIRTLHRFQLTHRDFAFLAIMIVTLTVIQWVGR
jgi:cobalt/nickel transport system permease protein